MQVGHAFRSPPSPHVTALRLAVAPSGRCRLCGATATGAASLALVGVGACAARRASRLPRSAIQAQETKHARAVRKWLEDVVIGFGFCPWAAPADIRVVTSKSSTANEVLADLAEEAEELWQPGSAGSKTTLVVCPNVKAWNQDFRHFHAFYTWHLDGGFAMAEPMGVKVVPFHPTFALARTPPKNGDTIYVPGPDGQNAKALVMDQDVGKDEAGEFCMAVQFETGEQGLIRHACVMAKASEDCTDQDLSDNFTSRAPRPVLHLLRIPDLEKAERESNQRGDSTGSTAASPDPRGEIEELISPTQDVVDRNITTAQSLGPIRLAELLERCG
ncbi:unnamed protein product [Symbiodinium natans]|uniref:Uncharacterized protein n=1 Tax=Symbiodinium natans TaxID=878477 RepID=A0A812VB87_9DINO|nr:unnamed protein product [Symbiodinium natans]